MDIAERERTTDATPHVVRGPRRPASFYITWTVLSGAATLACLAWPWDSYEDTPYVALLAGALTLWAGLATHLRWSKLLALPAAGLGLWFLVRLALAATHPAAQVGGPYLGYSYVHSMPLLVATSLGALLLISLDSWRLAR